MSEAEVLAVIEKVVTALAHKFVFGYFDRDDVMQTGRLYALDGLTRYNGGGLREEGGVLRPVRPLENFLMRHVRNRLCNLKRDKLRRNDPPCRECAGGLPCERAAAEGSAFCGKFAAWKARNDAKASAMEPAPLPPSAGARRHGCPAELKELLTLIDRELPVGLRADYLRLREGVALPPSRRQAVEDAVRAIAGGETAKPAQGGK